MRTTISRLSAAWQPSTWRGGAARIGVLGVTALFIGVAVASSAQSSDPDAEDLRSSLGSLSSALGKVADPAQAQDDLAQLADALPLTGANPLDSIGWEDVVAKALDRATPAALTSLDGYIAALNTTVDVGGLPVVVTSTSAGTGNVRDITVTVKTDPATAHRDIPITLPTDAVDVRGGVLRVGVDLKATLALHFDGGAPAASALSLSSEPTLSLAFALSTPTPPSIAANLGFTKVTATLDVPGSTLGFTLGLKSPHAPGTAGAGTITADDWTATSTEDLVTVTRTGSVGATLSLDTDLTPATNPDVTVKVADADLSDGFQPTFAPAVNPLVPTPGVNSLLEVLEGIPGLKLPDFTNVSPSQVLTGLGQVAGAIESLTSKADLPLPFMQGGVGRTLELTQQLVSALSQQTVVCGSVDAQPPTGPVIGLPVGALVYCSATTTDAVKPGTTVWTALTGAVQANGSGADADGTIATLPTRNATFTVTSAGVPPVVTAAYKTSDDKTKGVSQAVPTAQDLLKQLVDLAGFDAVGTTLTYDPVTSALQFALVRTLPTGVEKDAGIDFADKLKSGTGLFGLTSDGSASVKVKATDAKLTITFGVLLGDQAGIPEADPAADADTASTFVDRFFVKAGPGGTLLSVGDVSVDASLDLGGRIGFLEVTAAGASGPSSLKVEKADPTQPMLVLALKTQPGFTANGQSIAGAIQTADLLNSLTAELEPPALNLKASGGLTVTAKVGGTTLGTGGVAFTWGPVTTLADLTDASKLHVQFVGGFEDSLKKFSDLAADPEALLTIILDALDDLAASADETPLLDTTLPLVGTSPRDLLVQFGKVRQAVDELRGAPSATLVCTDTTDATRTAATAVPGDVIACRAETSKPADTATWSVTGGTDLTNATAKETVGPPPGSATLFTFKATATGMAGPGNANGFKVGVQWGDQDGAHSAQLPSIGAPATLQRLNDAIVQKLGLPPSSLVLGLQDVDVPGPAGTTKTLRLTLDFGACTQGNAACTAGSVQQPKIQVPINVDLGNLGEAGGPSYGLSSEGTVDVDYDASAVLDIGIPLSTSPVPFVFGATGAKASVAASSTTVGLSANVGPIGVKLGTTAGGSGAGIIKLAGGVTVSSGEPADTPMSLSDFATGVTVALGNGPAGEQDCGSVDYAVAPDPAAPQAVKGQVCARLALAAVLGADVPLNDIGLSWAGFGDPGNVHVFSDPQLLQKLKDSVLSLDFLLRALPPLLDQLESSLRGGGSGGTKIPVIGSALDGGADVVKKLNDVVTPAANGLADAVGAVSTAGEVTTKVQDFVGPLLIGANLLLDNNGDSVIDNTDVTMVLTCGATPCAPADPTLSIDDIRFDFSLGQGITAGHALGTGCEAGAPNCQSPAALPFDIGLDGLPLRIAGALEGKVSWRVRLDFGLSRDKGPYLGVNHTSLGQKSNDVEIGAAVTLGAKADACSGGDAAYRAGVANAAGFSNDRCLLGSLGFLTVNVRDKAAEGDRSGVFLTAGLHLTGKGLGDNAVLGLTDILGGKLGAEFNAGVEARVNLLFRAGVTTLDSGADIGFPGVLGRFAFAWQYKVGSGTAADNAAPTIVFDDIYLDGGAFVSKYLQPVVQQIQDVTSPLKPVIDTLSTPIPVVSDLAALVGQPPVTLLGLAEVVSTNDLSMVKSVVAFLQFVNDFPPGGSLLIPLKASNPGPGSGVLTGAGGKFTVPFAAAKVPQTPGTADSLVANKEAGSNLGGALSGKPGKPGGASTLSNGRYTTFGVPGLDIPILRDPSQVFSVLMGKDITLIEYEFGGLTATAGFSYSFGPFMIGPVPVVISIGGSVQIDGHFGLGYDTSGLRAVFGGAGPEAVLNGLYLKDFDNAGRDVPEIKLTGTVYAGAAVSISIVSAGIEAGLKLTVGLDLDDRPNNDGRLNFDEIVNRISNPICLFTVEGSLDAFLRAFVEFDFFIDSVRFDFTILEIRLLDFSAGCAPPKPVPATPDGGTLRLNIGDRKDLRKLNPEKPDEKVVVRPLETGGFSVEIFGAYEEYPGNFTLVTGNGLDGKDEVLLTSGSKTTGSVAGRACTDVQPCELAWPSGTAAHIDGGDDNDKITTATGSDVVTGGKGDDKLATGGGTDTAKGGEGSDNIDGGTGDDFLYGATGAEYSAGGDGADTIQGGPGADEIYGASGPDLLSGGPGVKPGTAGAPPDSFDGADHVYGGSGPDSLVGHEGDDVLYGDESLPASCTASGQDKAAGDDSNDDRIEGGPGNDTVAGGGGDDQVKGWEGNDTLCGNGGNDAVDGDEPTGIVGDDTVRGGPGNDVLNGYKGADVVDGGTGNDNALGGDGNDAVLGGTGRDRVDGSVGDDLVIGEDGTLAGGVPGSLGGATALANSAKVSGIDDTTNPAEVMLDCTTAYSQAEASSGNSDCVSGGAGNDAALGGGGRDTVLGDDGNDWLDGGSGNDLVRGGLLDDTAYGRAGDDEMYGDSGDDQLFGNEDVDTVRGGLGLDHVEGNGSGDTLFGDDAADRLIGGSSATHFGPGYAQDDGIDTVRGGEGDDVITGDNADISGAGLTTMSGVATAGTSFGNDKLFGDGGFDQVYGQQGADEITGGAGPDYLVGDLGAITPAAATPAVWPGEAPHKEVVLIAQAVGGADTLKGGTEDDHAYGGAAGDTVEGEAGDDYLEGNAGQDTLRGGADQDDLVGGSSTGTVPVAPRLDMGEVVMEGGDGVDVMAGDNADITRTVATATTWAQDAITGGAARAVVLLHSDADSCGTPPDTTCGGDLMKGGGANDRLYGEGSTDTLEGNDGDDYVEGNQATDTANGNDGEDDLVGGSSEVATGSGLSAKGRPDAGDFLYGDDGADLIAGDNAVVTRVAPFSPVTKRSGMTATRNVQLLDLGTSGAGLFGGDLVEGGSGVDVAFGQSGADRLKGGTGDDYVEGAQDADVIEGGAGEDDLVGGSSSVMSGTGEAAVGQPDVGDHVFGGAGADLVTGDNAQLLRVDTAGYPFSPLTARRGMTQPRTLRLLDLGPAGNPVAYPLPGIGGPDALSGGTGTDVLLGQDDGDWISGGPDGDYAEGNGGIDRITGDRLLAALTGAPALPVGLPGTLSAAADLQGAVAGDGSDDGQDDLIGGSSNILATDTAVKGRDGFRDGGDEVWGDGRSDFVLGDNGTLLREASTATLDDDKRYAERYPSGFAATDPRIAYVRHAVRLDVPATGTPVSGRFGGDTIEGNDGDDFVWGQSGSDVIRGGNDDDDLIGELGADEIYGENGKDAVLGDRGGIISRYIDGSTGDPAQKTTPLKQPPQEVLTYFRNGTLDRRVDLRRDVKAHTGGTGSVDVWDTAVMPSDGETYGSPDKLRGGHDKDALHGGSGNDLINGDSGGDIVFGDKGSDVLWGGRGCDATVDTEALSPDCYTGDKNANGTKEPGETWAFSVASRGKDDRFLDNVFGGYGGLDVAGKGDPELLDFRPRGSYDWTKALAQQTGCTLDGKSSAGTKTALPKDPCEWFQMTDIGKPAASSQHYQGTDWLYGGFDRDVLEGDTPQNGPNPGDRLLDWFGVVNLYNHCNSAYGGFNDVRLLAPDLIDFTREWAFAMGAGETLAGVGQNTSSGFWELGLVTTSDQKANTGSAYPTTPGHFEQYSCLD